LDVDVAFACGAGLVPAIAADALNANAAATTVVPIQIFIAAPPRR
jgi:hypothetical protein